MFNLMSRTTVIKTVRSSIALTALALFAACGKSSSATSGGGESRAAASDNARTGQVVITGAINKTYTPREVAAVKIGDDIGINVNEKSVCGVSVQFPIDAQPGSYPIEDRLHQVVAKVFGEYGSFCDSGGSLSGNTYQSTNGKLTLTASGAKFSGAFEFSAGNLKDQSKTIQVSGSFNDVSLP